MSARGLVVMIVACQVMDPGSIPGERSFLLQKLPLTVKRAKWCRNRGSNTGPLDLQSNALPTELSQLVEKKRTSGGDRTHANKVDQNLSLAP